MSVDSVISVRIAFMPVGWNSWNSWDWNAWNSWDDDRSWLSWHGDANSHSASSNADWDTWNRKDDGQSQCSTATMTTSTVCDVDVFYALTGKKLGTVTISSWGTVSELRIAVQSLLGSEHGEGQRVLGTGYVELLWGGEPLLDGEALLSDKGISHGSQVQAVVSSHPRCFDSHSKYKNSKREIPAEHVNVYKLFAVVSVGCIECTRYLIESVGVDVNSLSMNQGYTALDWAIHNGHTSVQQYLILSGGVSQR